MKLPDRGAEFVITLARKGAKALNRVRRVRATLRVSFAPSGAKAIPTTSRVWIRR